MRYAYSVRRSAFGMKLEETPTLGIPLRDAMKWARSRAVALRPMMAKNAVVSLVRVRLTTGAERVMASWQSDGRGKVWRV